MKLAALVSLSLVPILAAQEPAPKVAPVAPLSPVVKKAEAAPVYDVKADANVEVAAAIARARKEHKRVLIQWGANWCGWCKWLAGTMKTNPEVSRKLLYEYEVVHVDVGQFDKHTELAKKLGCELHVVIKAIPFLTVLDADGKALVQQNTEPFETKDDKGQGGHDPKKLVEFLAKYQAAPLVAKEVLAEAQARAQAEQKLVFLHFGAPWCGWCHRLENWLAQPEVAALLAKDFVDVKIDNDRMTGGSELYAAQLQLAGSKESGIPWFMFTAADGKVLAASDGKQGTTIGFPYEKEEVEQFAAMLRKVKRNLTDADVQALQASLDAIREADKKARAPAGH